MGQAELTKAAVAQTAAAGKEVHMEYDKVEEDLWEDLQHPYKHSDHEPLFEEQRDPEEEKTLLKDRVETLEYRLERALLCLNQCQKELAEVRKGQRELVQVHTEQKSRNKLTGYGICTGLGVLILFQVNQLTQMGWKLIEAVSKVLGVNTEPVSGVLAVAVIVYLIVALGRWIIRRLTRYQNKRRKDNAVCDR